MSSAGIVAVPSGPTVSLVQGAAFQGFRGMNEQALKLLAARLTLNVPSACSFAERLRATIAAVCPELSEDRILEILHERARLHNPDDSGYWSSECVRACYDASDLEVIDRDIAKAKESASRTSPRQCGP
jgi:hypothetical protein